MANVICVLYDDPVTGYPKTDARDDIPKIERYAAGVREILECRFEEATFKSLDKNADERLKSAWLSPLAAR